MHQRKSTIINDINIDAQLPWVYSNSLFIQMNYTRRGTVGVEKFSCGKIDTVHSARWEGLKTLNEKGRWCKHSDHSELSKDTIWRHGINSKHKSQTHCQCSLCVAVTCTH